MDSAGFHLLVPNFCYRKEKNQAYIIAGEYGIDDGFDFAIEPHAEDVMHDAFQVRAIALVVQQPVKIETADALVVLPQFQRRDLLHAPPLHSFNKTTKQAIQNSR